ncbi:MAG TPA: hypothetical protein VEH56_01165 [Candidatus Saccharimonadales bacterium]|nr:hypothetical protein [Candidatus Saccharimonadales bacterium]
MSKTSNRSGPDKDELWRILAETVHALPMYANHKRYVSEIMLQEKSDISSKELAVMINITLGEAIVILAEIANETRAKLKAGDVINDNSAGADRKLFDFTK